MNWKKIVWLHILLLDIQLQMFKLCFSVLPWASFEAKQIILFLNRKLFIVERLFTPHSTLQHLYGSGGTRVCPHSNCSNDIQQALCAQVLQQSHIICSRALITNHHKNISAMSWGHNGWPRGGPSIMEILPIVEHSLGLWELFLKHNHLCSRLQSSSSVLWVIQH